VKFGVQEQSTARFAPHLLLPWVGDESETAGRLSSTLSPSVMPGLTLEESDLGINPSSLLRRG
jgi:hypothetical protein